MARELEGWARARPLRVAFLIELDDEHISTILDAIFADCYGRWGGRFSLIVPCANGCIPGDYWHWLEAYDPDVVYSYVDLARDIILEIHARLNPAQLGLHQRRSPEPRVDVYGFKPHYDSFPLSSLSTIFWLSRFRVNHQSGLKILDSWISEPISTTFADNFGLYHRTQSTTMFPVDARVAGDLLTVVSPQRANGVPPGLSTVSSEHSAIDQYIEGGIVSLAYLSTIGAPKLNISHGRWSESFNLVVGEASTDRVMFWNGRLLLPSWLDNDVYCLRVTIEQLRAPGFAHTIGGYLKRRNYANAGSGGPSRVTVRSTSENDDVLTEAAGILRTFVPWAEITTETVNLSSVVPAASALDLAVRTAGYSESAVGRHDWSRFTWTEDKAKPPIEIPLHLKDAPARQFFTSGYWSVDLVFEYDGLELRMGGDNQWSIPKQWRFASAFEISSKNADARPVVLDSRRNRSGNLTVAVCGDHPIETIKIPSAEEAIRTAFVRDGQYAMRLEEARKIVIPPNKVAYLQPSNEARYFAGVLGMAGSLTQAISYLLHPFLRDMFARLGGAPSLDAHKVQPTVDRLRKRAPLNPTFNIRDETERLALGTMIVKAARDLKRPTGFVSLKELKIDWARYLIEYWKGRDYSHLTAEEIKQEEEYEANSLQSSLIGLRKRKFLFQGHRWTCPECHHRNWIDLADLSPQLRCEVCNHQKQAPVEIDWLFRPNEFLIESLGEHSTLSLVWTLETLRDRARYSFIYVGPTAFYFGRDSLNIDAEADLLAIIDGRSFICEVKSSWSTLRRSDITNFVSLAIRLRPDVAVLSIMERSTSWPSDLTRARDELEGEGIKFELLMPDANRFNDAPYLPYDDEN